MTGKGALEGLVVVDFTQFLSGPFATQILGDLGAEVIKVEPLSGDSSRVIPPYYLNGESGYYLSTNRNKKSIALDLKQDEGRQVALDLVRNADIVMSNFRPGVIERLGLGYDDLVKVKSDIIFCSITGYGETGPYRDRPAYDMVVQGLSGVMSLTGQEDGEPVRTGVPIGDLVAGLYANISILSALLVRNTSGKGQRIDISMFDSQVSLLSYLAVYYMMSGDVPGLQGRGHMSIPTYRSFKCSDGKTLVVTANTEVMWKKLCDVIGHPKLVDVPEFNTNELRLKNKHELWPILEEAFLQRTAEEWVTRLNAEGVPAAPVNSVADTLEDPHTIARGMVKQVEHVLGGRLDVLGNPIKMTSPEIEFQSPPVLGQHSRDILRRLGYDDEQANQLISRGIVGEHVKEDETQNEVG